MFLKHAQCITEVATPMCLILVKTLDDMVQINSFTVYFEKYTKILNLLFYLFLNSRNFLTEHHYLF